MRHGLIAFGLMGTFLACGSSEHSRTSALGETTAARTETLRTTKRESRRATEAKSALVLTRQAATTGTRPGTKEEWARRAEGTTAVPSSKRLTLPFPKSSTKVAPS